LHEHTFMLIKSRSHRSNH